jgi:hypothetical protein
MPMPWETEGSPEPKGNGMPWENATDTAVPDGFQPTQYGFKVKQGEAPTGGPATIRDDGAINFPGQSHWLFYDPKTQQYAPAPSEPIANKGFFSRNFGLDTLTENARNFGVGTDRAVNAGLSAAQGLFNKFDATRQTPEQMQGDKTASQRVSAIVQAMNNTGKSSAQKYQDIGQMAPAMAASTLAPVTGPTFLARALPGALTFGTATGLTTEGDLGDRAKAAGGATAGALAGQGIVEKGLPLAGKAVGALTKKLTSYGKTPAVQELLDSLGSRFGGQSPGRAAQDAAWEQYNGAWDKFKAAIAPVDEAAGGAQMDYSGPVKTIEDVLGVGRKRSPAPLPPKSKEYLTELLGNLKEAGAAEGAVDSSATGAIDLIKQLGAQERILAGVHGETASRDMLKTVRDSILKAMDDSHPDLAGSYGKAREIFAKEVAPLFDKSEGGHFLTQLRDTPTPDDWIGSSNQGSLTRMKADKAAIVAKGSSPEPLLFSMLDAAVKQSNGNPGSFVTSIEKAMPAVQKMAADKTIEPEMLAAFQGLAKVARTAKFAGWLGNMGVTTAGTAIGGPMAGAGAASASLGLHFKPAYSAPGLMWSLMQTPATRKLLTFAGKMPAGSPELELIAKELSGAAGKLSGGTTATNITPLRPKLPAAADTGNPDTVAQQ